MAENHTTFGPFAEWGELRVSLEQLAQVADELDAAGKGFIVFKQPLPDNRIKIRYGPRPARKSATEREHPHA